MYFFHAALPEKNKFNPADDKVEFSAVNNHSRRCQNAKPYRQKRVLSSESGRTFYRKTQLRLGTDQISVKSTQQSTFSFINSGLCPQGESHFQ